MEPYVLTTVATRKIQRYVFNGNRLRENVGASYLVKAATDDWVNKYLSNAAQIVYSGGGATQILFPKADDAIAFTRTLSRHILKYAPGLQIQFSHHHGLGPLELQGHDLIDEIEPDAPSSLTSAGPLLGLGVTVACGSTGLVAVDTSDQHGSPDRYPVSREIVTKLDCVQKANTWLNNTYPLSSEYIYPYDLDNFGRSHGDQSYIAIIHADGNGLGKRIRAYRDQATDNGDYLKRSRAMSTSIQDATDTALQEVVRLVQTCVRNTDEYYAHDTTGRSFILSPYERHSRDATYLPLRILIAGGDDVTIVCDGRIGLAVAAAYLQAVEQQPLADGEPAYACAGVAIVKTHYPFARGYALAEQLCDSAKRRVRPHSDRASAIDWHIATTGLLGDLDVIREREYHLSSGMLTPRPLLLHAAGAPDWTTMTTLANVFLTDAAWVNRRNKVLQLREVLRNGPDAVKQFTTFYGKLPDAKMSAEVRQRGWLPTSNADTQTCLYFDAIEMMEFYWPLPQEVS